MMTRLEGAYRAIEIGERKEAESDLRRAHTAYETAITDFMHLSFSECGTREEVISWNSNHPLEEATTRFIRITNDFLKMPRHNLEYYFPNGNYLLIAFSHFYASLGQFERARFFARIAEEPILFSTTFWGEFGKMYGALIAGKVYSPKFGKLNFLENYERPYIGLMSAVMYSEPYEAAIAEIDRQFIARNADSRMNAVDAYMIEGSQEYPVKFDFRKEGLLAIVENTKSQSIT